jgi:hypothetical protein
MFVKSYDFTRKHIQALFRGLYVEWQKWKLEIQLSWTIFTIFQQQKNMKFECKMGVLDKRKRRGKYWIEQEREVKSATERYSLNLNSIHRPKKYDIILWKISYYFIFFCSFKRLEMGSL